MSVPSPAKPAGGVRRSRVPNAGGLARFGGHRRGIGERSFSMGWRRGELWLDTELWLPEGRSGACLCRLPGHVAARATHSRRDSRHHAAGASRRRQGRRRARRSRASVMALSPVVAFALAALPRRWAPARVVLGGGSAQPHVPLRRQHRPGGGGTCTETDAGPDARPHPSSGDRLGSRDLRRSAVQRPPRARNAIAGARAGLGDVQQITDSGPNMRKRLYGNEHTIRAILSVTRAYRAKYPHAPRVVIGDISREHGGPMDDHASHQNGLDVDVYFPRRDREQRAPDVERPDRPSARAGPPRSIPRGRCADDLRWLFDPPSPAGRSRGSLAGP